MDFYCCGHLLCMVFLASVCIYCISIVDIVHIYRGHLLCMELFVCVSLSCSCTRLRSYDHSFTFCLLVRFRCSRSFAFVRIISLFIRSRLFVYCIRYLFERLSELNCARSKFACRAITKLKRRRGVVCASITRIRTKTR